MGRGPPDFSSKEYWQNRFKVEKEFEWLAQSNDILPLVIRQAATVISARTTNTKTGTVHTEAQGDSSPNTLRILHFGCGSSNLGSDIKETLKDEGISTKIIDADYVPTTSLSIRNVPIIQLDVLDLISLQEATEEQGGLWDILVDKSTADAISCGPGIPLSTPNGDVYSQATTSTTDSSAMHGSTSTTSPIEALCSNLAQITRPGGRWISISYSSTRFNHLSTPSSTSPLPVDHPNPSQGQVPTWTVRQKIPLGSVSLPEGRMVKDGKGETRIVYEPETPIWAYILERI